MQKENGKEKEKEKWARSPRGPVCIQVCKEESLCLQALLPHVCPLCVCFLSALVCPHWDETSVCHLIPVDCKSKRAHPQPQRRRWAGVTWIEWATWCRLKRAKWKCQAGCRFSLFVCGRPPSHEGALTERDSARRQLVAHCSPFHVTLLCWVVCEERKRGRIQEQRYDKQRPFFKGVFYCLGFVKRKLEFNFRNGADKPETLNLQIKKPLRK